MIIYFSSPNFGQKNICFKLDVKASTLIIPSLVAQLWLIIWIIFCIQIEKILFEWRPRRLGNMKDCNCSMYTFALRCFRPLAGSYSFLNTRIFIHFTFFNFSILHVQGLHRQREQSFKIIKKINRSFVNRVSCGKICYMPWTI